MADGQQLSLENETLCDYLQALMDDYSDLAKDANQIKERWNRAIQLKIDPRSYLPNTDDLANYFEQVPTELISIEEPPEEGYEEEGVIHSTIPPKGFTYEQIAWNRLLKGTFSHLENFWANRRFVQIELDTLALFDSIKDIQRDFLKQIHTQIRTLAKPFEYSQPLWRHQARLHEFVKQVVQINQLPVEPLMVLQRITSGVKDFGFDILWESIIAATSTEDKATQAVKPKKKRGQNPRIEYQDKTIGHLERFAELENRIIEIEEFTGSSIGVTKTEWVKVTPKKLRSADYLDISQTTLSSRVQKGEIACREDSTNRSYIIDLSTIPEPVRSKLRDNLGVLKN